MPLFSVGHSTHTAQQFARILHNAEVNLLVDVRSHPTSRWEQHRKENYERWLPRFGVTYLWLPELGGWTSKHMYLADDMRKVGVDLAAYSKGKFPKQRIAPDRADKDQDPAWTNQGLYDYSWFTALPEFQTGVDKLVVLSELWNAAIMCCEGPWFKCHRSMIADCLVFRGHDIRHIPGRAMHSEKIGNRIERYHPAIIDAWKKHK
jgi:uncharacterized protein (DUF488 family)